ncbi:hypothetical protein QR680_003838 [Steinernema hermaphroditum]|uniref:3'-5' exonuclease domain-containing protein n=1 Tax=Steinernema hermaphroditum TaxID=289476 RepID=A0AA39HP07_9BILA|nr:hypothetical protein QR680_003838 [Steinernema hermaphroditum]
MLKESVMTVSSKDEDSYPMGNPTRQDRLNEVFEKFKNSQKGKKGKTDASTLNDIKAALTNLFINGEDPLEAYFTLFEDAARMDMAPKLLFVLACEILKECIEGKDKPLASVELQTKAFNMLLEMDTTPKKRPELKLVKMFTFFAGIFIFDQMERPLGEYVKMFLLEGRYASAATLLSYGPSHLLEDTPNVLQEVIIPFFIIRNQEQEKLQSYTTIIIDLARRANVGTEFVEFLDKQLESNDKERMAVVAGYRDMPENGYQAFCNVKKDIKLYADAFRLSKPDFPNYRRQVAVGDLDRRFKMYYTEKTLTLGQFEDHARNAMLNPHALPILPDLFLERLKRRKDDEEVARWEAFFQKPQTLKQEFPEPYELDGFSVEFVRTETSKDIEKMTEVVRKVEKGNIIALDCENQAVYVTSTTKIALLQFAFDKKVFVVDTHSLGSDSDLNSAWKRFFEVFFGSGKHQVFGFGLDGDISNIGKTYAPLKDIQKKNVIKTERLIPELKKQLPNSEFFKDLNPKIGLQNLYKKCFPDQPEMDKSEQMSCFDRRPLRKAQLDYAARDVIVLLKIFEKFKEEAAREANGVDAFSMSILKSISS